MKTMKHLPIDAEHLAKEAWSLVEDHERNAAVALLSNAARAIADRPGLWDVLGDVCAAGSDFAGAEHAYSEAIRYGYPSFVSRGLVREQLENLEGARSDYRRALERDPADLNALINLGTLEASRGEVVESTRLLERAVLLDPKASWQLSDAYLADGRIDDARDALLGAIAAGEGRAYLDLALLESTDSLEPSVEQHFLSAIDAGATLGRRSYVIYLDNVGEQDRAIAVALDAVQKGDRNCYAPLAVIYESRGALDKAQVYYSLAIGDGEDVYEDDLTQVVLARMSVTPRPLRET